MVTYQKFQENEDKTHQTAPHGWLWAPKPTDFYHVVKRNKSLIGINPTSRLSKGVLLPKPEVVPPFPSLSIERSPLRSGGPKRTNHPGTDDPATVPKLEDHLPMECLPDNLLVCIAPGEPPTSYKRILPSRLEHSSGPHTSTLTIWSNLGQGSHGTAFRALLSLPEPYESIQGHRAVNVVVKFSGYSTEARLHYKAEADTYSLLSREPWSCLQNDWTGYVACKGNYGYIGSQIRANEAPTAAPLKAVVPKFFGSYEVKRKDGSIASLLLLEDCGISVHDFYLTGSPDKELVMRELRAEYLAMLSLLHRTGFLHGSLKTKNIAVQKGPLSLPVPKRTWKNPSFRLIDFGRAVAREDSVQRQEFRGPIFPLHQFDREAYEELTEAYAARQ